MRVSAVQFKAEKGSREASLSALLRLVEQAAPGSDLVVLPEMALTGYCFADRQAVRKVAEPADGPTFAALGQVARKHGCWIVAGIPELAGDLLFNSALVVDRTGELQFTYRKTLLFEQDMHWATPGDSGYRAFDTGAGRFGVGICMDLNDDGFLAWVRKSEVDAVAFPTNWVAEGMPVWPYWAWRMHGLSAALVAANSYGPDGDIAFSGKSAVLRERQLLAAAPEFGDCILRADLPG